MLDDPYDPEKRAKEGYVNLLENMVNIKNESELNVVDWIVKNPEQFTNTSVADQSLLAGKSIAEQVRETPGWSEMSRQFEAMGKTPSLECQDLAEKLCRHQYMANSEGHLDLAAEKITMSREWVETLQPAFLSNEKIETVGQGQAPREELNEFAQEFGAREITQILKDRENSRIEGEITDQEKEIANERLNARDPERSMNEQEREQARQQELQKQQSSNLGRGR